jgi:hypothetical protein
MIRNLDKMYLASVYALLGCVIAVASWGEYSSPAISLILPVVWAIAPSRLSACALTLGYHLAVVRFLPPFAGVWFESLPLGVMAWVGQGLLAASTWALLWPKRRTPRYVGLMTFAVLLATLLLPWAAVVPSGPPIMGLGFLLPGTAWFGVAMFFIVLPLLAAYAAHVSLQRGVGWLNGPKIALLATVLLGIVFGLAGDKLDSSEEGRGRMVSRIAAVHTQWGKFPNTDEETLKRIDKIGKIVRSLAGGPDGFDTVVFPESILGIYDVGTSAVLQGAVLINAREAGQTVVIGADLKIGNGRYQNVAIVFRPDGSTSYIAARQTSPVATWAPWLNDGHFPADWLANSTVNIGGGVRARFMFCFEEYMPLLHLISEAREDQNLVVAMSNGWASQNPLSSAIQSGHTEGMAKLFGRPWIRAENRALPL